MKAFMLSLFLLVAASARAEDFAYQWPLQLQPDAPLQRVELSEEVYASLADPLLRDLDVLDEAGARVPAAFDSERVRQGTRVERGSVAWFPLLQSQPDSPASLRAVIEGQRIEVLSTAGREAESRVTAVLLDLGAAAAEVRALHCQLDQVEAPWTQRWSVEHSADLSHWQTLRDPVQLYRLRQQSHTLEQLSIRWPGAPLRYLRLRLLDPSGEIRVSAVEAERHRQTVEPVPQLHWVELVAQAGERAGEWDYVLPGPLPVRQWAVQSAAAHYLYDARLASRASEDRGWVERDAAVLFQIQLDGETLRSEPRALGPLRDRHWRLQLADPEQPAPALRVGYLPDRLLIAPSPGQTAFLVAGSARARRIDAPMAALSAALRSKRGEGWFPPGAVLGTRTERAGAAALQGEAERERWGRWLLWGVLIAVAATLGGFALRLMRPPAG